MIKAIIFDAYGTLISTGTGSVDAVKEILNKRHREDINPAWFYGRWKEYHRANISSLVEYVDEETIFHLDLQRLYQEYDIAGDAKEDVSIMLKTLGNRKAFADAVPVLEELAKQYGICIGSTTDTAPLLRDLQRNKLTVNRVFTSQSLQVYKPQKAFYQRILSELQLTADEIIFVGDSFVDDVSGPQSAEIKACWVNRKNQPIKDFSPDYVVSDLYGIIDIMK